VLKYAVAVYDAALKNCMESNMSDIDKPVVPTDGMIITSDTTLIPGVYILPKGITIGADNVTLDCGGAILIGDNRQGNGITLIGRHGVTVKNARIRDYYHGIHCEDCSEVVLNGNQVTSTNEIEANTIFLDIWLPPDKAYGGGIFLWNVRDSRIEDNDVQHQMNGILTYECERLQVNRNNASYNSGYGIHLWKTCDSTFEDNYADYCCRWNKRADAVGHAQIGHMGADATGFLIVNSSCRNVFRRNFARLGGDGFFLAGLGPDGKVPCNDNLFEENDGSLSPNIAFEATFSGGNIFRNNRADRCNYGFWLGFSWDITIEDNRMVHNRQAGVACDNGRGFRIRRNKFHSNAHGVLCWSGLIDPENAPYPEAQTSFDWVIEKNEFIRNGNGVTIAADRDHGIHPVPEEKAGHPETRPHDHTIVENTFQDNRIGVSISKCDKVVIENNVMNRNVEAHIRQEDSTEVTIKSNLGSVAGYL